MLYCKSRKIILNFSPLISNDKFPQDDPLLQMAVLNLNIHTSYFSHTVNYSHECVTFWYVWNIRTTNFEIIIGTSFSQISNFRHVKDSYVFVTPVKNSSEFFPFVTNRCEYVQICANSSHVWQIRSNVKVKRICNKCEKIERICHNCEGLGRIFHICNTYAWHVW